jgi:hypothetical protein
MCRKLISLASFVLVLGLTITSASEGTVIQDDFEADTVDLTKWRLINGSSVSITQSNGRVFFDRPVEQLNYLVTVGQFDPEIAPLTISGSVTLAANGDMDVWTRANIIANTGGGPGHILDSGIRINFWQDAVDSGWPPNLDILEKTAGTWPWDSEISDGTNIPGDDEATDWDFIITDNGETITATFTQTSDPTNTLSLTGTSTTDFDTDYIAFTVTQGYLNEVTIQIGAPYPYASHPTPEDGTRHSETWVSLGWRTGGLAASHDVYLGENFDDVNESTHDSEVFRGNQTQTFYSAGSPDFAYPDGLVPGTTYYWRIDEVNDAEPDSPWKGPVWSFSIPPKTAYDSFPANGARFVDSDVTLTWTPGFGARLHIVYFGDNFDDVNGAAGGPFQGITNFTPGILEPEKTYYWRVDEFDTVEIHKGEIWSFTIAKEGGGVRGDYFRGMDLRDLSLTRTDAQINFNWPDGTAPDETLSDDNFSVRWTGELEAAFTETYTFYTNTNDGVGLWIDGRQIINRWTDASQEDSGTIELVEGNTYSIVMEMYDNSGSATAQLSWESPSTPKQFIPQAALSLPVKAGSPYPYNGAAEVKQELILEWRAGDHASSHQVYFDTDEEAVRNANTGSSEYKGIRPLGSESYDPGQLEWGTTYYWRIDEVNSTNSDSPWTGNIWSFMTADFLIVDNFEDYNDYEPYRIFDKWSDGFLIATNGSLIGYEEPDFTAGEHFVETTIVHSGSQSMPYFYDNSTAGNSEATLTLVNQRDWTERDVSTLTLWFTGDSANSAESMYVVLDSSAVVYNNNPNAALITEWTQWNIDLQEFTDQGINLTDVNTIGLGFGNRDNPQVGGSGLVFFDDIRLYLSQTP